MDKRFVFATNNANKVKEIKDILPDDIQILCLKDIECYDDIPEDRDTLQGNAQMKAEYIYNRYHVNCFADDTGLEVEALGGEPGVRSARYASEIGHDSEANMDKLLSNLEGKDNRKAQFRTVICLIMDGKQYFFEGIVKGRITQKKHGEKGFGYDPIFAPEGFNDTFAELGSAIKNKISHRAKATAQLVEFLSTL